MYVLLKKNEVILKVHNPFPEQILVDVIKTESIRKSSTFNFQWTKTLYQNDFKHTAFFFMFFKGYRCN